MWMDARNWEEEVYRDSVLKAREAQSRTVFRTTWAPSPSPSTHPNPDAIVVASSDGLIASYSLASCVSPLPGPSSGRSGIQNFASVEPDFLLRGHDGPAYDVKFYGDDEDALLLSCGDDGRIRGWKWKEVNVAEMPNYIQETLVQPTVELVNPQHNSSIGDTKERRGSGIDLNLKTNNMRSRYREELKFCLWKLLHIRIYNNIES